MTSRGAPRLRKLAARRERGFALLIVLWTTSLLALIGAQVTSAGRTEARLAGNLRGEAIAQAAADAAVQDAGLRLLVQAAAKRRTVPAPYLLRLPQAAVTVTLESESRKLPVNTASLPVLVALLEVLGHSERSAKTIAGDIAEWRSPANVAGENEQVAAEYRAAGRRWGPANRPFRSPEDLGLVLSMTPALLAEISPHVSVYTQSSPNVNLADPAVAAAMHSLDASGDQLVSFNEPPVYGIVAHAVASGGGAFTRRAVFRLNISADAGTPLHVMDILAWSDGP